MSDATRGAERLPRRLLPDPAAIRGPLSPGVPVDEGGFTTSAEAVAASPIGGLSTCGDPLAPGFLRPRDPRRREPPDVGRPPDELPVLSARAA
ncbi:MAG: hypothetical protein HY287_12880 [Planctomycetes bacterium]|nr:hypothetical protein [Planctomycetota bacterium]MBI3835217.1 hypothetical protein [Planctomycetota bacterium]